MENQRAVPAVREHRLYQADYLLRQYGFNQDEIVYQQDGNLPLANDPKVTWALAHPERFPVEIRTASYEELLRVPGVGPGTAKHLVEVRGTSVFRDLKDLQRAGVRTAWASGFITLGGRRLQTTRWTEQLGFWQAEDEVGTPHVVYEVSPGTFR
jgi:predicted DNA-binding helix-hairpin-helix protein